MKGADQIDIHPLTEQKLIEMCCACDIQFPEVVVRVDTATIEIDTFPHLHIGKQTLITQANSPTAQMTQITKPIKAH